MCASLRILLAMGIHAGFPINSAALNFIKGEFLGLEVEFCKKQKLKKNMKNCEFYLTYAKESIK